MAKKKIKVEWRNEATLHFYEILEYLIKNPKKLYQ